MASNKQTKNALNSIKMQAASEVGVPLNNGYNGDLTAKQAGSIGGQMVKDMIPIVTRSYHRYNITGQMIHYQILLNIAL